MSKLLILPLLVLLAFTTCHLSEEEIEKSIDEMIITYGSTLKVQNVMTKF